MCDLALPFIKMYKTKKKKCRENLARRKRDMDDKRKTNEKNKNKSKTSVEYI